MKTIQITTEYITLGQLLKLADFISAGGEAKAFLAEAAVTVNGVPDIRRGRKLYPNDELIINGTPLKIAQ